jgi:hypothetical protein
VSPQSGRNPTRWVGIYFCDGSKAGQFAGFLGTLEGTGENAHKGKPPQSLAELMRVFFAPFIQRQIGSTGMLMRVGPGPVTVPGEIEFRQDR